MSYRSVKSGLGITSQARQHIEKKAVKPILMNSWLNVDMDSWKVCLYRHVQMYVYLIIYENLWILGNFF